MTRAKDLQWMRLVAEATAIVVSILLAFAIDAWWESRSDREAERSAIKRLVVEFEYNIDELGRSKQRHQRALEATEQLLALIRPGQQDLNDSTTVGALLVDCLQNPTFDPRLGTTNSLIASGDLHLLRDEQLQGLLTEWPTLAGNLLEWQIIERNHGEELILPFTYDFVAWPSIEAASGNQGRPSEFESDFNALFSSLRFEGMLNNRRYNVRELLAEIETLEEKTKQLIERLNDQSTW